MIRTKLQGGSDPHEAVANDPEAAAATLEKLHSIVNKPAPVAVLKPSEHACRLTADTWYPDLMMTDEEAEAIKQADFLVPSLIVRSSLHAIVAEPNGGKTTLLMHLAPEMVRAGCRVLYVSADIGASHVGEAREQAQRGGFNLVVPDFKNGRSMETVRTRLEALAEQSDDLSGEVLIIDTLKKMVDVIQKGQAKRCYQMFRKLTARGMTVILLGHTNKHKDSDGKPVYEGTGDLRADVDNLIYLLPRTEPDGSMTVSTKPDKVRAQLEPLTFQIAADRTVTQCGEYVDIAQDTAARIQRDKDDLMIDAIFAAIGAGQRTQTDIVTACKDVGGASKVRVVLKRYEGELWEVHKGYQRNRYSYSLLRRKTEKLKRKR